MDHLLLVLLLIGLGRFIVWISLWNVAREDCELHPIYREGPKEAPCSGISAALQANQQGANERAGVRSPATLQAELPLVFASEKLIPQWQEGTFAVPPAMLQSRVTQAGARPGVKG